MASEQDKISANALAEIVNKYDLNWLDFVCERGNYLKFFEKYSENFLPEKAKIINIQKENNLSSKDNYKLHRELGILFR